MSDLPICSITSTDLNGRFTSDEALVGFLSAGGYAFQIGNGSARARLPAVLAVVNTILDLAKIEPDGTVMP